MASKALADGLTNGLASAFEFDCPQAQVGGKKLPLAEKALGTGCRSEILAGRLGRVDRAGRECRRPEKLDTQCGILARIGDS